MPSLLPIYGGFPNLAVHFGSPYNKRPTILGSIPDVWNLPFGHFELPGFAQVDIKAADGVRWPSRVQGQWPCNGSRSKCHTCYGLFWQHSLQVDVLWWIIQEAWSPAAVYARSFQKSLIREGAFNHLRTLGSSGWRRLGRFPKSRVPVFGSHPSNQRILGSMLKLLGLETLTEEIHTA